MASSLGDEKPKAMAGFHVPTGCDTVEKFTSKSKETWKKHFLQAGSKIFNAFYWHPEEHFSQDFKAIERFVVTSYVPKSSKVTDFAEAWWYVFSKIKKALQKKSKNEKLKDVNMGKLPSTKEVFPQHYLRSLVQERIWHEAMKACINHVDPQEYGWKPSDEGFIAIETEDDIVPQLLLTICRCKSNNCATRSCNCSSNGIPCADLCSCHHKFCENTDPKEILEDNSSDGEDDIENEEGEGDEYLFTNLWELSLGGFNLCFLFVNISGRTQNLQLLTFW